LGISMLGILKLYASCVEEKLQLLWILDLKLKMRKENLEMTEDQLLMMLISDGSSVMLHPK
ncbi:hypothetical protein FRX31_026439, partial [Thalictrum thalictroides]